MRKLYTFFLAGVLTYSLSAQAPQRMSYQAVIRNNSDGLVTNHLVGMKISILKDAIPVYVETLTPTTTINGLVTIEIGSGTPITGTFMGIDWSTGTYFIKTETDPTGGTSYTITGTSQILSVPFSLFSKSSGTSTDAVKTTGDQSISGVKTFTGTINANNKVITNVATPINTTDAANKSYVDAINDRILQLEAELGAKDIDGNTYKAVKIGNQIWMAENLRTTKYSDGSDISNITDNTIWAGLSTGAYCWYNNNISNKNPYGALYNFYSVIDSRNICPIGWHVPTNIEWLSLSTFLGGDGVSGGKLKEAGLAHWNSPNTGATNETGFTSLPGGARQEISGYYNFVGLYGYYWTSSEFSTTKAYLIAMAANIRGIAPDDLLKTLGFSVRCMKNF